MRTRTRRGMMALLNALPTTLGRSGGQYTHAFCLAALTSQRHVLLRSSSAISSIPMHSRSSSSSSRSISTRSLQQVTTPWAGPVSARHEYLRVSTALSAKGSMKRGKLGNGKSNISSSNISSSSSTSSNNSSGSNSSRKNDTKRQRSSSTAAGAAAETRGKGLAVESSTGGEQALASRPAWTGPRLAGPRPVAAPVAAGAVGWTSPYSTVPGGGGRGGRGGQARGLHDSGPTRPDRVPDIPEDQLEVSFSRSSGAGGQNVNKLSTKVEMRFVVSEADWLPHDVRLRLARQQSGRMNNRGELVVTAQEFRTQRQNRSQALHKLKEMVEEAWEPAKERKLRTGISKTGKEIRKADKRHRSQVKAGRSKVASIDYD